jgi:hypothetical protein
MTDSTQAAAAPANPQDEMLPFLNNFHDVFTTIGVLILFGGLAVGAGQVMSSLNINEGEQNWQYVLMALIAGIGLISWMLSSLLVGKQRRILPGIVLSGAFSITSAIVLIWAYAQFLIHGVGLDEAMVENPAMAAEGMEFGPEAVALVLAEIPWSLRIMPVVMGLAFFLPAAIYYLRFRLPFAGGIAGAGLVGLGVLTFFMLDPYAVAINLPAVNVAAGGALLLAGIVFDMRDPDRSTRLSGTAFWLHFFAAPILLAAVMNVTQVGWTLEATDFDNFEQTNLIAAMASDSANASALAAVALLVIGAFALVSLLINRRALIVSGLLTAGIAISVIVGDAGLGAGAVVAVTMLLLGGTVVLLGAAWNPVRRMLLTPFPSSGPLARLFPPASGAVG